MSLFTKVKCKYYFQKKVDNKALSKSGRQTQLLRSTETYSRTFCQASLTVEAAVVLPLFIGFMVFLLFYFRIMQTELAVEQAMMYTARVEAACVSKSSDTVHPAKVQLHFLKSAKEEKVPFEYIDGEKAGISFRKSDYEGTELMLHASYRMTIPIGFFGTLRISGRTGGICKEVDRIYSARGRCRRKEAGLCNKDRKGISQQQGVCLFRSEYPYSESKRSHIFEK